MKAPFIRNGDFPLGFSLQIHRRGAECPAVRKILPKFLFLGSAGLFPAGLNGSLELNVCLLAFAAAVTLMLLLGAAADRTRRRPFMRYFIVMLAAALFTLLGETGLWLRAGDAASRPWL